MSWLCMIASCALGPESGGKRGKMGWIHAGQGGAWDLSRTARAARWACINTSSAGLRAWAIRYPGGRPGRRGEMRLPGLEAVAGRVSQRAIRRTAGLGSSSRPASAPRRSVKCVAGLCPDRSGFHALLAATVAGDMSLGMWKGRSGSNSANPRGFRSSGVTFASLVASPGSCWGFAVGGTVSSPAMITSNLRAVASARRRTL